MTLPNETRDETRAAALRHAEDGAVRLFDAVIDRGLIVAGKGERELSDEVRDLAHELLGVERYWHKRIVRSGPNTLEPYRANPPDRLIAADDIVFLDFGPILDQWESDFGRTYVLGDDPEKHRMASTIPLLWQRVRDHFLSHPDITGEELFDHARAVTAEAGWEWGIRHAGHLIGKFPHERIEDDEVSSYITTGNTQPLRRTDAAGEPCHWILEIHLVDRQRGYGAFFEQLLDV